jgi:hypothetical protein
MSEAFVGSPPCPISRTSPLIQPLQSLRPVLNATDLRLWG